MAQGLTLQANDCLAS